MASAQVTHKRSLSMLGSPFEMIVEAKDIPEADTYIDMAVAEVSAKT
jgi:thiamine biosynthesis lipoprotein